MIFLDFISANEQNEPVCSSAYAFFAPRCCDDLKTSNLREYTRYKMELRGGSAHSPKVFPYTGSGNNQLHRRSVINPNPMETKNMVVLNKCNYLFNLHVSKVTIYTILF